MAAASGWAGGAASSGLRGPAAARLGTAAAADDTAGDSLATQLQSTTLMLVFGCNRQS